MNLGAPILDVQVTSHSSTATATQAQAQKPVSIVSGGVVSAPGYTPIVITKVTPASYTGGASAGIIQTTTTGTVIANPQISTSLSGDKVGVAGNDIITHSTTSFNPNVKIVINKKSKF
jgi:hypothetical protein